MFDLAKDLTAKRRALTGSVSAGVDGMAMIREHYENARGILDETQFDQFLTESDPTYVAVGKFATSDALPFATRYELFRLQHEAQVISMRRRLENPGNVEQRLGEIQRRIDQLLGADAAASFRKEPYAKSTLGP